MRKLIQATFLGALLLVAAHGAAPQAARAQTTQWIDHLGFLAGDPSVLVSFNAVNSGVGGGLSGLIIESTTTGEIADGGGNKVIETALQVPPGFLVNGVRVCYELSNADSFISQIRLAQVQDPPAVALVLLDDGTDLVGPGPVCLDSLEPPSGPIDPVAGPLLLSLRVNFGDTLDRIVLRGVALNIERAFNPIAKLRKKLKKHKHIYLTGRGTGHNNTEAKTSRPTLRHH